MMVSPTASRGVSPPAVTIQFTSQPAPIPPPPPRYIRLVSCPTQHGLGRSSVKSANDEGLFEAIVSSITARIKHLSLAEGPSTITAVWPVYTPTPAGTDWPNPTRAELLNRRLRLLDNFPNNRLRARIQNGLRKRIDRLNGKAPIPSSPAFQLSPIDSQDHFVAQVADSRDEFSTPDALEARLPPMFSFAVQQPPAQQVLDSTFLQLAPSDSAPPTLSWTAWRTRDEVADEIIDEFGQQPQPHPLVSPVPMDVETNSYSRTSTLAPEWSQVSFEESADRGAPSPVPEPVDATMSDQEKVSASLETRSAHQIESTDAIMNDASSTPSPPLMISRGDSDVNMGDAEDDSNPRPLERAMIHVVPSIHEPSPAQEFIQLQAPPRNPSMDSPPATSEPTNAPPSTVSPPSAQPLQTPELSPEVEINRNVEADSIQRYVALSNSIESSPASTANATPESTVVDQVTTPSSTAANSTAGPSTPAPTSPPRNSTRGQEQSCNGHAARVHQVLGKLVLSKQSSTSTNPSTTEEASEEAEAEALIAQLKSTARRQPPKSQKKPLLLLPSSEPKPTKGSVSRSLMDDLMAGFRRSTNSNSSSAQVSAPTHSHSAAKQPSAPANALSTSTAAQSTHRRSALAVAGRHPPSVAGAGREVAASLSSRAPATIPATANVPSTAPTGLPAQKATLPVVAGRQLGPRPNLSSSAAGTSRQVAAWPAGRAPSTVSAAGEVNGPPRGRLIQAQTPSEAVPHGAAGEPAGAAMDGVESGQRAIRGSRRVARLMRATGTNWQTVQLQAQQTQAALDTAQSDATAWAGMSSRDRDEEELRTESQRWHAAQPPPPPETLRYINIDEEVYTGDPDDEGAYLDWLLRLED